MNGLTDFDHQIIRAMAEYDLNEAKVSRVLYSHRNTITYRLKKIQKHTGLNPNKFWDLVKLNERLDAEEIWTHLKGE